MLVPNLDYRLKFSINFMMMLKFIIVQFHMNNTEIFVHYS